MSGVPTHGLRHEQLATGRVVKGSPFVLNPLDPADPSCIVCHLDAEGCTIKSGLGDRRWPMCFWCLELWEVQGVLASIKETS